MEIISSMAFAIHQGINMFLEFTLKDDHVLCTRYVTNSTTICDRMTGIQQWFEKRETGLLMGVTYEIS